MKEAGHVHDYEQCNNWQYEYIKYVFIGICCNQQNLHNVQIVPKNNFITVPESGARHIKTRLLGDIIIGNNLIFLIHQLKKTLEKKLKNHIITGADFP